MGVPNNHHELTIRFANIDDVPLIYDFIKSLAIYEKMIDQVTATHESLKESLFVLKQAEVIIASENEKPFGFALFFHNYSTFLGKSNLYLEDLFILKSHRNKGYGKKMLSFLAKLAVERKCSRLDWVCLNWNHSSIEFYKKLGATALDQWIIFRVSDQSLIELSKLES